MRGYTLNAVIHFGDVMTYADINNYLLERCDLRGHSGPFLGYADFGYTKVFCRYEDFLEEFINQWDMMTVGEK